MSEMRTTQNDVRDAAERMASQFRQAILSSQSGTPEGTVGSLRCCVRMLNEYAPDLFPANDKGQVHFARAIMESVADEIAAYLVAEHPADDDEPVTREWLHSVGFQDDRTGCPTMGALHIQPGPVGDYKPYACLRSVAIKTPATRGDVRRLAKCLGIELQEQTSD